MPMQDKLFNKFVSIVFINIVLFINTFSLNKHTYDKCIWNVI